MVTILMMSAKMATVGYLLIKVFSNKGYAYDITNKILSHKSNYIVDVVKWQSFFSLTFL